MWGGGDARLEASVDGLLGPADFALDLTAPVKGAGTAFDHFFDLGPVAPTAAHEVTAVDADGRLVADAALRPCNAQLEILLTKVGRVLVVHQILLARRFVFRIVRFQLVVVLLPAGSFDSSGCPASVTNKNSGSTVESIFQVISHHSEEWKTHPASPHRTRSAHSVAFAFLPHFSRDVLQKRKRRRRMLHSIYPINEKECCPPPLRPGQLDSAVYTF